MATEGKNCLHKFQGGDSWTLQLLWFNNNCPKHNAYIENIVEEAHTNYGY